VLSLFRDGLLQTFSKIQVSIAGTNWIVIESGLIVLYQMVLHE
jgi:L-lactate utilization protein LutB